MAQSFCAPAALNTFKHHPKDPKHLQTLPKRLKSFETLLNTSQCQCFRSLRPQVKIERAHKLIKGLGAERGRWTDRVEKLRERVATLPGDCMHAAAMIAYGGPFPPDMRTLLRAKWYDRAPRPARPKGVPPPPLRVFLPRRVGGSTSTFPHEIASR